MLTRNPAEKVAGEELEREAEALHEALSSLVRLYQFRDRDQICCFDVSVPQCNALEAVVKDGPLTLGELAERLYVDKSTASRIVDALERKGYLGRAPHPMDARALSLSVTPAGTRLAKKVRAALIEDAKAVLAELSPAFRREAVQFFTRLTSAAAVRLGRGPGGSDDGPRCSVPSDPTTRCSPARGGDQ
jgi:MarR family 2-MHQ and catechol resistance regulon transcriptional repressor